MSGKIINLRRARKSRDRADKRARTDQQTRPVDAASKALNILDNRRLDGHELAARPDPTDTKDPSE